MVTLSLCTRKRERERPSKQLRKDDDNGNYKKGKTEDDKMKDKEQRWDIHIYTKLTYT